MKVDELDAYLLQHALSRNYAAPRQPQPGGVSPGRALRNHSRNLCTEASPSAGAQGANSAAVAGSYGPSLISRKAPPAAPGTTVCQAPWGVSYPMLSVPSPTP